MQQYTRVTVRTGMRLEVLGSYCWVTPDMGVYRRVRLTPTWTSNEWPSERMSESGKELLNIEAGRRSSAVAGGKSAEMVSSSWAEELLEENQVQSRLRLRGGEEKGPPAIKYSCSKPYYTIHYYTILYYTILCYTIVYYTVLYYAMVWYAILYINILNYTIL